MDLSLTAADPQILKLLGDLVINLAGAARHQEHMHFANVRVSVNFQPITGSDEVYSIDTFTELSNGKETFHNTNGNPVVVNTFLRNNNLRTYTKEQFQADVMEITRQNLPSDLAGAQFGLNAATLYVYRKDALFREIFLEVEFCFIENKLFTTVCPGISYLPSSIINQVKQVITDGMNGKGMSIHNYFIKTIIAMNCMGEKDDELDVVRYTVENMDTDIVT